MGTGDENEVVQDKNRDPGTSLEGAKTKHSLEDDHDGRQLPAKIQHHLNKRNCGPLIILPGMFFVYKKNMVGNGRDVQNIYA